MCIRHICTNSIPSHAVASRKNVWNKGSLYFVLHKQAPKEVPEPCRILYQENWFSIIHSFYTSLQHLVDIMSTPDWRTLADLLLKWYQNPDFHLEQFSIYSFQVADVCTYNYTIHVWINIYRERVRVICYVYSLQYYHSTCCSIIDIYIYIYYHIFTGVYIYNIYVYIIFHHAYIIYLGNYNLSLTWKAFSLWLSLTNNDSKSLWGHFNIHTQIYIDLSYVYCMNMFIDCIIYTL